MRVLAVTGIVAGIAYVFTPLTASGSLGDPSGFDANLRYVAPALIVGFVLLPLIPWIRHGQPAVGPDRAVHDPADPGHGDRTPNWKFGRTTWPRSSWPSCSSASPR